MLNILNIWESTTLRNQTAGQSMSSGSSTGVYKEKHMKRMKSSGKIGMKNMILVAGCLCILAFAAAPAQAVTIQDLTIALDRTGNADVHVAYQLSTPEYIAVYLNLANPSEILKKNLEASLQKTVTVNKFSSDSVDVSIPSLASAAVSNGTITLTSPQISLEAAQKAIEQYWFAPLLSPDFSPESSTVAFPDGYKTHYTNQITIPSVTHTLEF